MRILEQALEAPARRPGQRRRPASHPAAEAQGPDEHGGDDPPLQAGDGGPRRRRSGEVYVAIESPEGRAGLLLRLRRHGEVAVPAGASARRASSTSRRSPKMVEGDLLVRRDRHQRAASTSSWGRSTDERAREAYASAMFETAPSTRRARRRSLARYPHAQGGAAAGALDGAGGRAAGSSRGRGAGSAERLGVTPAHVKGVVTFYTMYHQKPVGEVLHPGLHDAVLRAARRGRGGRAPVEEARRHGPGRRRPDGRFTVVRGRVPRRVRHGADDAGQRRLPRERDAREGRPDPRRASREELTQATMETRSSPRNFGDERTRRRSTACEAARRLRGAEQGARR